MWEWGYRRPERGKRGAKEGGEEGGRKMQTSM